MVQLRVATSIVFVQIALLAQTTVGLPIEDVLNSRLLPGRDGAMENDVNSHRRHHDDNQAVPKRDVIKYGERSPSYSGAQEFSGRDNGISKRDYMMLSGRNVDQHRVLKYIGFITAGTVAAFLGKKIYDYEVGKADSKVSKRDWDSDYFDKRDWNKFEERGWDEGELEARDFDEFDELD
ncbi:hypothetical protein AX15_001047 [Amanita polypyramis BW_CC]|nr:hypothetical protein AX15_001047 [Amanita polypyramis BW_CC]